MWPDKAYEAIRRALDADPRIRIVGGYLDEKNFGNFVIAFEAEGEPRSIINDRGELALCKDLKGYKGCATILLSLAEADEEAVLRALPL